MRSACQLLVRTHAQKDSAACCTHRSIWAVSPNITADRARDLHTWDAGDANRFAAAHAKEERGNHDLEQQTRFQPEVIDCMHHLANLRHTASHKGICHGICHHASALDEEDKKCILTSHYLFLLLLAQPQLRAFKRTTC